MVLLIPASTRGAWYGAKLRDFGVITKTLINAQCVQTRNAPGIARARQFIKIFKECLNHAGVDMKARTCKTCGVEKPLDNDNFQQGKGGKYFSHECKLCRGAGRRKNPPRTPDSKKYCNKCGCEINTENAYRRKKGIDVMCKPCRLFDTKTRRFKKAEDYYLRERADDRLRDQPVYYKRYMRENPFYFSDVWEVPATRENIERAANQLF